MEFVANRQRWSLDDTRERQMRLALVGELIAPLENALLALGLSCPTLGTSVYWSRGARGFSVPRADEYFVERQFCMHPLA